MSFLRTTKAHATLLRATMAHTLWLIVVVATSVSAQSPEVPQVTVAHPVFKQINEWDEFTGRFVAKHHVNVRARVAGYLESVHFEEGQMVEQGQLLFVVDRRPFEAEVARAHAELARVTTQLKSAQLEFERGERLASSRAMSRETMEERRATRDAAQAEAAAASARLRAAKLELGYTEVRAPISGRSSDIRVDAGNLLSGGSADSTILTTIVSLDPIELEIEASEAEFLRLTRLSQSGVRPSSRDQPNPVQARLLDETEWAHLGHMTFVDNQLDVNSGTMRGRATFPNRDLLLLPGMFARARLGGTQSHDAVLIPDSAIVADQATKLVMVLDADNVVNARPVTLGPLIDGLRVVRTGLTKNDRLVVNGIQRARPGTSVSPTLVEIEASDAK